MYPLLPLYLYFEPLYAMQTSPLEIAYHVETTNTLKALHDLGLDYPEISSDLISKYVLSA